MDDKNWSHEVTLEGFVNNQEPTGEFGDGGGDILFSEADMEATREYIGERLRDIFPPTPTHRVRIGRFLIRIGKALARE